MNRARIVGTGAAVPKKVLSNADLEKLVETSDEWITTRTGIKERRIVSEGEKFSDLCTKASELALKRAHMPPEELDMILVGTISSDMIFPATSCLVQHNLGATKAAASDVSAACVGFLYGLHLADGLIQSNKAENVLVVGGEILSRFVDWTDRSTCVLFGDGAGAVVLQASDQPGGMLGFDLFSDGTGCEGIIVPAGGSAHPASHETVDAHQHTLKMMGTEVYKYATRQMGESALAALRDAGMTPDDVDQYVFHQANLRIIASVQKQLAIPDEKTYVNIEKYGNTSAASVPMALAEAVAAG